MGKWSGLRTTVPLLPPSDPGYQARVDQAKLPFRALDKASQGRQFCELREQRDAKKKELEDLNLELEAVQQLMIAEMERTGEMQFKLSSGDLLSIKDEPYCSVAEKDEFLKWVRETDQDDLLTVHYMTLSALTKARLQEGKNAPPGIKVFLKQSITRYKGR